MWNKPTDKDLKDIPTFYATEKIPAEDKVHVDDFVFCWDFFGFIKSGNVFNTDFHGN